MLVPAEIEGCSDSCVQHSRPSKPWNTASWRLMVAVERPRLQLQEQPTLLDDIGLMGHCIRLLLQAHTCRMIWEEYRAVAHRGSQQLHPDNSILRRSGQDRVHILLHYFLVGGRSRQRLLQHPQLLQLRDPR
jgi:hypothetical protein